jgi:hypothetical protein
VQQRRFVGERGSRGCWHERRLWIPASSKTTASSHTVCRLCRVRREWPVHRPCG